MTPMNRVFVLFLLLGVASLTSSKSIGHSSTFVPKTFIDSTSKPSSTLTTREAANDLQTKKDLTSNSQSITDLSRGGAISINLSEVKAATIFVILDYLFRQAFVRYGINFPSQLGGCCILFIGMLLANVAKPGLGDSIFAMLGPGSALLAKWLPVFFVPGLAMLPLAPSMGSPIEILKVLLVVVLGFYYSAATTSFAVLALRKMEGSVTSSSDVPQKAANIGPVALPFSSDIVDFLTKGLILSGAVSIGATLMNNDFAIPLRTVFMMFTTFFGYVWGARLPPAFTKIVHPLVTSTVVTHAITQLTGLATKSSFNDVLGTYKSGSMKFLSAGAGDILLYLLGPSVVSFAISMYSRKKTIADNLLIVCTAMLVASVGGLFGTAAFVRLLNIGGEAGDVLRKSLLPRNVTTPLAIAITNILGGDISQAAAVVVLTGIFAATFGARFLTSLGITDPVSRGLGIGASGQGLGVASIMSEKEAFPFASLSMVLTAIGATTLVSIPPIANALVKLATGK